MTKDLLDIHQLRVASDRPRRAAEQPLQDILKGVDLRVARGEVVGLIGESGAGKSTLGLAALGFTRKGLRFCGGSIDLDGMDILRAKPEQLRRLRGLKVAYVAQSAAAAFNPAHRLLAQIVEIARIHRHEDTRQAEQRAIRLFERMGLPDPARFGARYPHEVSGGELQRAMTAMALAADPDLVVFDEPTTALDVTTQIEVLAIIKATIRERETAALYITHDLAVIAQVANRIKVMRDGAEVEEGDAQRLLGRPRERYTQALLNVRKRERESAAQPPAADLLVIAGINASYGRVEVLRDVSLVVKCGGNVAVVGESGSGKSTLARVIVGLLAPSQGTIVFKGHALSPNLPGRMVADRKSIQLVYQLPEVALNPRQSIGEIIARPARVFCRLSEARAIARARELLGLVDLDPNRASNLPGQLSGGEKQRVCIARALAAEPELIICDEVTSALDPLVAEGIIDLLLRLQREYGVSYIVITHDMSLVRALADDVIVMRNGRVVETGRKDAVLTSPAEAYTRQLIASTPQMRTDWLSDLLASRARAAS